MQGYRFYAELPENRGSKSATKYHPAFNRTYLAKVTLAHAYNNVVAVPIDGRGQPLWQGSTSNMDATIAVRGTSDSPVMGGSVSRDYLRVRCVRVSESLARKLHPALFAYLGA